ncbi:hypothetical protein [Paenibacillus yonginensis]|uniref:hypothetical protein n=1 Tax=Paenibacillus yonginensis TaxID=1462996 RepID=UPI0012489C42|nr:hypothetical protein [Paenibacillus yonginensis]
MPSAFAEDTSLPKVSQESFPASLSTIENVSSYKSYDTGLNLDAKIEFIDPKLASQNKVPPSEITPQAGERRVYVKSEYAIGALKIAGYNVGPINNQTFLCSVAKGHTSHTTITTTVTGTLQLSGTYTQNALNLVKSTRSLFL